MSTATKLAQRSVHTGTFAGQQQQRLAQDAARQVNSHADMLNALVNRSYTALAVDASLAGSALVYTALFSASITTVMATGYLLMTFTASGTHTFLGATVDFKLLVDNVLTKGAYVTVRGAGDAFSVAIVSRVAVTRGAHTVRVDWSTDNSTARLRPATVDREHAALLVQEAA